MMDNKPIAVFIPAPLRYDEWKRRFALHWVDGDPIGITHLYSEVLVRQQQDEIEALEQSKDRLIKTLLDVRGQQPVAWGMTWKDGEIYDVISPAQHDKEEGDYNIPLYTNPVKELHLSLQKSKQTGELLAVTYTDDEHRIVEVLWQRPPELTDEEILISAQYNGIRASEILDEYVIDFARAILRKAQENG